MHEAALCGLLVDGGSRRWDLGEDRCEQMLPTGQGSCDGQRKWAALVSVPCQRCTPAHATHTCTYPTNANETRKVVCTLHNTCAHPTQTRVRRTCYVASKHAHIRCYTSRAGSADGMLMVVMSRKSGSSQPPPVDIATRIDQQLRNSSGNK